MTDDGPRNGAAGRGQGQGRRVRYGPSGPDRDAFRRIPASKRVKRRRTISPRSRKATRPTAPRRCSRAPASFPPCCGPRRCCCHEGRGIGAAHDHGEAGERFGLQVEFLDHDIKGAKCAAMTPENAFDVEGCCAKAFGDGLDFRRSNEKKCGIRIVRPNHVPARGSNGRTGVGHAHARENRSHRVPLADPPLRPTTRQRREREGEDQMAAHQKANHRGAKNTIPEAEVQISNSGDRMAAGKAMRDKLPTRQSNQIGPGTFYCLALHAADAIGDYLRLFHHQKVAAIRHIVDRVVVVPVGYLVCPNGRHDRIAHPGEESHRDV